MTEKSIRLFKKTLTALFIFLLLISCIFLVRGYLAGHFDSVETMQVYISSFGVWAPLMLTVIQALQVVVPVLPGFLGCIAGAAMFGVATGFWCNYIGICLGSVIAYFLARKFGSELVERMFPRDKYQKFVDWINQKKSYTAAFFLAILLPLVPDDFFCYFTGLTKMSSAKFITIILIAKPWCILAYCLFFSYFI